MKNCRKVISVFLAMVLVLILGACASSGKATVSVKNGETVGQGKTSFAVEVTDAAGARTSFTVKTDEKTVGAALQALNLISGEESSYGLYIKEVTGITADYNADGTYWAFYVDGQYALTAVDQTDVRDGAVYGFAVEKMQ